MPRKGRRLNSTVKQVEFNISINTLHKKSKPEMEEKIQIGHEEVQETEEVYY